MKPHNFFIAVLLLFSGRVYSQNDYEIKLLKQFHAITSEEMMTWVEKLCYPELNGRLTGTPEIRAGANPNISYDPAIVY